MERMFVTLEGSLIDTAESEGPEPMRSKAATASYVCKLYRAYLAQSAASRFITPNFPAHSKHAAPQLRP